MVRFEKFILNSKLCMMQSDMHQIQPDTQPIHGQYIAIHCSAGSGLKCDGQMQKLYFQIGKLYMMQADMSAIQPDTQPIHGDTLQCRS